MARNRRKASSENTKKPAISQNRLDPKFMLFLVQENIPYTEATLNEAWRHVAVAPFGPPRAGSVNKSSNILAAYSC